MVVGPYLSAQAIMAVGKEATRGTAASVFAFLPHDSPDFGPVITWLDDKGMRGSPVDLYRQVPGVGHAEVGWGGDVHLDTFPNLIVAILGPDMVSGAGPYVHTIGLQNTTSGSQPASYTIQFYNGAQCYQMTGCQGSSLEFEFTAEGALQYKVKFIGNPPTLVTQAAATWTATDNVIPAYNTAVLLGGTANGFLIDGGVTIDRSAEAIAVMSQAAPLVNFAGPCKVSGKLSAVYESTDVIYSGGTGYVPQALKFTFTDPDAVTHLLVIQMSQVQLANPKPASDKAYVTVTSDFAAAANTTDATNSGFSPIQLVATTGQTLAY